ncbi:MAG: LamG-like jellyroll fold domain-containing protein, partial [Chloroflexota bacterium]
MTRLHRPALMVILLAVSLLGGLLPVGNPVAFAATGSVKLDAPTAVEIGQPIELRISVEGAANVGGFEAMLRFDRRAAVFGGVNYSGNDIEAIGRGIGSLGPVERAEGVALGFYSCPTNDCAQTSGQRSSGGVSGSVELATARIIPGYKGLLEIAVGPFIAVDVAGRKVAIDESSVIVNVGGATTAGGYGAPLVDGLEDGATASPAGALDLTGDGRVDNSDAREVALEWVISRYNACDTSPADIDGSGCVTVADAQAVANGYSAALGRSTLTVQQLGVAQVNISPSDFVPSATWTVNTTADDTDANIGNGICATAAGQCSLRAAIENANQHSGNDLINFNISGTGLHTITLTSRLPTISDTTGGVMINGYSQPGSSPNTSALASNAQIRVEIVGLGDSTEEPAFFIASHSNIVQGLAIYNSWRKIWVDGPGAYDNLIAGNYIGTDAAGQFQSPAWVDSAGGGIMIDSGAHNNQVGDRTLSGRNVISGNPRSGMQLTQQGTSFNVVVNNIIGLSPDGTRRLRNLGHGIDNDQGTSDSVIGGTAALERNVISGNDLVGIEFAHSPGTDRNRIVGNYIGTDLTGSLGPSYARNNEWGVNIEDGPDASAITDNVIGNNGSDGVRVAGHDSFDTVIARNRIGVSLTGAAIPNGGVGILMMLRVARSTIGPDNIIANNDLGIWMDVERENIQNRITHNSIYGNAFGIDLHPAGVNPNGQYPSTGPNLRLSFPALSSASPSLVAGRACTGCTVEVFRTDSGNNAYGQGRTFVGSAVAAADSSGAAVGSFSASVSGLAVGDYVTATATDANGNTSEFALDRLVTASGVTAPGALVARDTFQRIESGSWGQAELGGPWTLPFTPLSDYTLSGGQASINLATAGTTRMSILASVSERDVDAAVQVSMSKLAVGNNQFAYLVLRRKDNGNQYHAGARLATNGTVFVRAARVLNGSEAIVGSEVQVPGLVLTAGQRIWIRAQAVGASPTTIRIKVWRDGSLEPTAWNLTTTNSDAVLQSAGAVGLRAALASSTTNAPVVVSFDGFRVNAPAPADAVAPAPPTGLLAAPGDNAVYLGWNANSEPDLIGYHVYRSTVSPVSTSGSPISGTEPVTSASYVDTTAVNGTTYFYVVTAVDASTNRSGPSNQVSVTPDPAAGSALDFDGTNDYVTFGPAADAGVSSFTIEAWFRRDGPGVAVATSGGSGGITAIPILTKGASEADGSNLDMNYFLGIRSSDNVLAADFEDSATGANHAVAGSTAITSGVWHHAAATFNGTTWRLYLDGVLDATLNIGSFTPRSDSIQHAALATTLNSTGQPAGYFNGVIDEARVWNVARSQGQIATARDLQLTSGTGLVARWGLNEGTGNAVANSISGGSAGTALNGPIWVPGAPFAAGTDPAPAPPGGLTATPGAGQIGLSWNANSEPDLAGYNIYRDSVVGGASVTVSAAGDIASCSSTGDEATAALLSTISGDVLALGDNVYESGTLTEFNNCYNPTWGQAKARTHPAPGNHEYGTANAAGYFSYFGSAAGSPSLGYYSYNYGTWHIVVLNSNCANVSCAAGSTQEQWLRADLAASSNQCTLAFWHHPRFSSGNSHGNNTETGPLFQALYDYNADVALAGHEHNYERFAPQTPSAAADPLRGIREFVVGTGGRSHYGFGSLQPNSQVRNADTYGVLKLNLKPGGYDWEFMPEAGKTFTDSGSDVCHDANGPLTGSGEPLNGSPITSTSYSDTSVAAGVQYHYTVTAVDAAGHESAPSNQASAIADPPVSAALDFDGVNDHVTLGPATALNSNTFTIETWFRQDGAGQTAITSSSAGGITAYPMVTKGRSGGGVINWFLGVTPAGLLGADFESASDDSNHGITGTTVIATGVWHHAAATYDGTNFRLYLDGNLEASTATSNGPGTGSNHPAALATALDPSGVPAGYFNGVLDEVRVWNVARTQAQILSTRDQELTSGSGLISRWGLNEGAGTAISNSVAGGPAGAAVNSPLWVAGSPFTVPDSPPAAPTGLFASPGNNSVALSWNANLEADIAGYRVYRGTSLPVSSAGAPLSGAALLTSPNYLDSTAINGTLYYYVVTAVDQGSLVSPASSPASATPSASAGGALDFDGSNDHVTLGGQSA